jgi:MerR family transcriptional regulator/heat shock protein HspR
MARDPGDAVYIISVAAELAGVHPQTLRIYERRGLLSPQRTPGGTRRYSEEDLEQLGMIQELTADGVNLEGVRRILEMRSEIDRLRKQVNRLRRLLGEAEQRYQSGTAARVGYATAKRRHLPDVNRPDLGGMVDR